MVAGVILIGLLPALNGATTPGRWQYQDSLDVSRARLTQVALPDSTLDLAHAELADLRPVGPSIAADSWGRDG